MSANLLKNPFHSKLRHFQASYPKIDRRLRQKPMKQSLLPFTTNDEEWKFVGQAAIWILAIPVLALLLFHAITYFDPEFFLIR